MVKIGYSLYDSFCLRYTLLPFWYTMFYSASISGLPIIRPLWMVFPDSLLANDDDDEFFMIGDALLVAPVLKEGQEEIEIPLPTLVREGGTLLPMLILSICEKRIFRGDAIP